MVFVLTGCQFTKAPEVTVREVGLVKQTAQGAQVRIDLVAQNEHDYDLPIISIGYTVWVDGQSQAFTMPNIVPTHAIPPKAEGRRVIPLLAGFDTGGVDISGRGYRVEGALAYRPPGALQNAKRETGIPWPKVSFAAEGVLEPVVAE